MTLGIDIGGTTITLGLVRGTEVVQKSSVPSFPQDATVEETMDYLARQVEQIFVPAVEKIGIGVPSIVDPVRGIVYDAMNIPSWKEVHIKEILEKRFGVPVFVNNDANCYALGAASKVEGNTVVTVTLGTGTGVGIVTGGKLFCGAHCGAGEMASIRYAGRDYESYCSKKYFTGKGITDTRKAAKEADNGSEQAKALFSEFGAHLGEFLSVVMYAYDPDTIVLGGGIAHTFRHFSESMWDSLRNQFPYNTVLDDLSIRVMPEAELALVGAASLN
ncbi:MAG: ROK family protein [Bacteroidales bacterium]|nr:ROK family protein [Bacteroidales bacterium]